MDGSRINGAVSLREVAGAAAEDLPAGFPSTGPSSGVTGRLSIFFSGFFGVISSFLESAV